MNVAFFGILKILHINISYLTVTSQRKAILFCFPPTRLQLCWRCIVFASKNCPNSDIPTKQFSFYFMKSLTLSTLCIIFYSKFFFAIQKFACETFLLKVLLQTLKSIIKRHCMKFKSIFCTSVFQLVRKSNHELQNWWHSIINELER